MSERTQDPELPTGTLLDEIEAFLQTSWRGSTLWDAYFLVNIHAPYRTIPIPRRDLPVQTAARLEVFDAAFPASERLWWTAMDVDPRAHLRGVRRIDARRAWHHPDWNVLYDYVRWAAELAPGELVFGRLLEEIGWDFGKLGFFIDPDRGVGVQWWHDHCTVYAKDEAALPPARDA